MLMTLSARTRPRRFFPKRHKRMETSVDEKSLRAALRVPWPLYSTRIVCTLQCEALMSLVDVPKPSGEPPEQLHGTARLQRAALQFREAYEVSELVADKTPARGTASRHPPRARGSRDLQSETHLTPPSRCASPNENP